MNQPKATLYENLSIPPQASRSEIDMAYRQALKGLEIEELAHYSVDAQGPRGKTSAFGEDLRYLESAGPEVTL